MRYRHLGVTLSLSILSIGAASPALGLADRVFASARSGNNANSCDDVNTPCRTLAGALTQVVPGGAVIVLDAGGYGPVTITQSVTIEAASGVTAFIHPPSGGDAITINAGTGSVVLRGLVLNGNAGFGIGQGIVVNSVRSLYIDNCVINGFAGSGIYALAPNSSIFVKDTIVREGKSGLVMITGTGVAEHCRFEGNELFGVLAESADITVRDSVMAGNRWGCVGRSSYSVGTTLNVYNSLVTDNFHDGVWALIPGTGPVTLRVANCSISGNGEVGLHNGGGPIMFESMGNNFVRGNLGGDVSGPITIVPGQ